MRIERVDDTTVKLFITYSDIEARGFSREDLWTNRKRGEEFFWSMMDEINEEEDDATDQFDEQVQELLAQTLEGEDQLEELFEQRTKEKEAQGSKRQKSSARKNTRTIIVKFNDLEDVINYAYHSNPITTEFEDLLYMVDGTYYYAVHFDSHVDQEVINDSYSQLLEFAYPTDRTEVYLNDYAKIIMSHNVTAQVRRYFPETAE